MQGLARQNRYHADDLLSSALRSLHVSGSLLLCEAYAAPWAIHIPSAERLGQLLRLEPGTRALAFHLVEYGHCAVQTATGTKETLHAGEIAICFGGEAHHIGDGPHGQVQNVEALLAGEPNHQHPDARGQAASASLVCGVFLLQHTAFHPMLAALPRVMRANLVSPVGFSSQSGIAHSMVAEMKAQAAGSAYVVERLLEVLCAQAIRAYLATAQDAGAGWVRAIRDPVVGRAMCAMHARPGAAWSVPGLAREVAISPSRFAARFSAVLGDSPMAYLTKLRLHVACGMLLATQEAVDQVAFAVGYDSAAAFNRTFKNHLGLPPGAWRAQAREPRVASLGELPRP